MRYIYKQKDEYLIHHGIKGQKWGVRRYQNLDGSYTDAGKKRYSKNTRPISEQQQEAHGKIVKNTTNQYRKSVRDTDKAYDEYRKAKKNNESKEKIQALRNKAYEFEKRESNEQNRFVNESEEFIKRYGHKNFQKLMGDSANIFYTEMWRVGLDGMVDYTWDGQGYFDRTEY